MIIGVPKEIKLQEHRIGLTPDSVKTLTTKGHKVLVQKKAGFEAGFYDDDYINSENNLCKYCLQISLGNSYKIYKILNINASM